MINHLNHGRWILGTRRFIESYRLEFPVGEGVLQLHYALISPDDLYDPRLELSATFLNQNHPRKSFGIRKVRPLTDGVFSKGAFYCRIEDAILKDEKTQGALSNQTQTIEWQLTFTSEYALNMFPFKLLEALPYPEMKMTLPALKALFSGTVTINQKKYTLDRVSGIQTHTWGHRYPYQYNFGYARSFDNQKDSSFFAYSSKNKLIAGFETPDLPLFFLNYQGTSYRFNGLKSFIFNRDNSHIGYWYFKASTKQAKIEGTFEVEYKDLTAIREKDINNESLFIHYGAFGKLTLELYIRDLWTYQKRAILTTRKGASVRFAKRYKDPHVNLIIDEESPIPHP